MLAHCVIDSNNAAVGSYLKWRGGVIVIPKAPLQPGRHLRGHGDRQQRAAHLELLGLVAS